MGINLRITIIRCNIIPQFTIFSNIIFEKKKLKNYGKRGT